MSGPFLSSSRRPHTRLVSDWSSDVCSSDLMRTNTQEAVLSAYIASIGKRTPRDAAQDAAELCRLATSLNRLRSEERRVGKECRSWRSRRRGEKYPTGRHSGPRVGGRTWGAC